MYPHRKMFTACVGEEDVIDRIDETITDVNDANFSSVAGNLCHRLQECRGETGGVFL